MTFYLCLFCGKEEVRLIGFHQKRHDECRKKKEFIQKSNTFWDEYKGDLL